MLYIEILFPKNSEEKFPGIKRMKKVLFQTTEKEPDLKSPDFKENYKELFVKFNEEHGNTDDFNASLCSNFFPNCIYS